jgi:hypothetical protein
VARSEPVDMRFMEEQLDHIRRLVAEREEAALIAKFKELVPQYRNGVPEPQRSEVGGRRSEVKAR